jgi:hypothetical protein
VRTGCPRRDHRRLASGSQGLKNAFVGVECLVGDQHIGRHRGQELVCSHQVVRFTAGQEKAERIAERVDQCMDLGAQSAARAPDCLVLAGFFWRRRYADGRTIVLSIMAYSLSASAARCWNTCSQTPLSAQRLNRRRT